MRDDLRAPRTVVPMAHLHIRLEMLGLYELPAEVCPRCGITQRAVSWWHESQLVPEGELMEVRYCPCTPDG